MSLILNIDTAIETASVCLSQNGSSLGLELNDQQKLHASWLHVAIAHVLRQSGKTISDVNAVAVTIGPGSYTGLRVSLSAAKGICYARNIPLITIGTLPLMALAARDEDADLLCPMIDARRMEVFAALYDKKLQPVIQPMEMKISQSSFHEFLNENRIVFLGNGARKLQLLLGHKNALFSGSLATAATMAELTHNKYNNREFADLVYTEPFYLKDFYTPMPSFA